MNYEKAYFLSHNGLGDNITNIGAINFLLQYYRVIYFLCKDKYEENVKLLFSGKNVITVPFDSQREFAECRRIISTASQHDIFVSGCHTKYVSSRITHPAILNYAKQNKYTIKYSHIAGFYNSIGLDSTIYVDYFAINTTDIGRAIYEKIKHLKIIFMHTQASNRRIDLSNIIAKYIENKEYILLCANKNAYPPSHPYHIIAQPYINILVAYYIDIITHAEQIHIIDSCFSCIVYPLMLANKLSTNECIIYDM